MSWIPCSISTIPDPLREYFEEWKDSYGVYPFEIDGENIVARIELKNDVSFVESKKTPVPIKFLFSLLPKPVREKMEKDSVTIEYGDCGGYSKYSVEKNKISCVGIDDFFHEIGHWCYVKLGAESGDNEFIEMVKKYENMQIPDGEFPKELQEYAKIIGARDMHRLRDGELSWENSVYENFARNFNALVVGLPFEVVNDAYAEDVLEFYVRTGLIGADFDYRSRFDTTKKFLRKVFGRTFETPTSNEPILVRLYTPLLLDLYSQLNKLSPEDELALRSSVSLDFSRCLLQRCRESEKVRADVIKAMKVYGTYSPISQLNNLLAS